MPMARWSLFCLREPGRATAARVDEFAVGELALQPLTHGRGQVELVHLEIDLPELDIGFFQGPATEFAASLADLFAERHRG